MPREHWREEDGRERRWDHEPRGRDDFGQADYSTDYAYDPRRRSGYRAEEDIRPRGNDYGQADYTNDWVYDAERGRPYRRYSDEDRDFPRGEAGRWDEDRHGRSWRDRAGAFFSGRRDDQDRYVDDDRRRYDDDRRRRRRGPSDRVLWAVIMERLEDDRRVDLRDVDVLVEDGEVTLNGTVRRKEDKRRIEDLADIEGVRNVQNNLRVRERDRGWTFL